MRRVVFVGESHSCPRCVDDEIAYSEDFSQIAVEIIAYTKRNIAACQDYNRNGNDVTQFISKLNEYKWSGWKQFLEVHEPLFHAVKDRNQKILPLRPWGPNDHYVYALGYIEQYLSQDDNLMAIMGGTCAETFLEYFDMTKLGADIKFHNVHVSNAHE